MRHVVIIPARNEAAHIGATLQSILKQTKPPDCIYVVDDGSSDETSVIVADLVRNSSLIRLLRLEDRGHRRMGEGVVQAFTAAYQECRSEGFTYLSKVDADLLLPQEYFETLLGFLDDHPEFGAAGGVPYDQVGGKWRRWRMPPSHVPGPLKTMRRAAYDAIGGFVPCLGWDILDEVKMRSLGYRTGHLEQLKVLHLRPHASAEGMLRGKAQWGEGAYVIGSHPLFVLARAFYRMWEPPYIMGGVAMLWGYCKAAAQRLPQIASADLIQTLRREQLHRLFHLNQLPSPKVKNRAAEEGASRTMGA
jgi:biofilm PGA synthesis N-glycosyltransferase PgaC